VISDPNLKHPGNPSISESVRASSAAKNSIVIFWPSTGFEGTFKRTFSFAEILNIFPKTASMVIVDALGSAMTFSTKAPPNSIFKDIDDMVFVVMTSHFIIALGMNS
jgi:hypothetical protein